MKSLPRLLNIGCGTVLDSRWKNIDLVACAPGVREHDILSGLPANDDSLDAVYSSHVLEHLTPLQAEGLLRESWRVLRPGGVIRVVVPDLEGIVRGYLHEVDLLRSGQGSRHRHQWMLVELLDQMTRTYSGGNYGELIRNFPESDLSFAEGRLGRSIIDAYRRQPGSSESPSPATFRQRIRTALKKRFNHFLGIDIDQARFRASGEIHQWMYDGFILAELLESCGFSDCCSQSADKSDILGWSDYALDLNQEGHVRKPDSLFMEAKKPSA